MGNRGGFFSFLDDLTYVDDDASSYEIGVGDNGFSYVDMMSPKRGRLITFEEKQRRATSAALDGSTGARGKLNIKKIVEIDHDALCLDTDLAHILRDIQARHEKVSIFPFAVAFVALVFLVWLLLPLFVDYAWLLMLLTGIFLFPGGFLLLWNVWKLDISRKHLKFKYSFSGSGRKAFDAISESLKNLAASGQVLVLCGLKHFEDTRYSGGAASLPILENTSLGRQRPPLLDLDIDVWHVRAFHKDLYFMPDHLLVFEGARVGGINYTDLRLTSTLHATQARDKAKRTEDCKVVGTTHRFVNLDSSPDQRFNNNIEIPIIEYGVLNLSGAGLDLSFYASRQNSALQAPSGFSAMQRLAALPVEKVAEKRRQDAVKAHGERPVDIHEILVEALCCMMVSDGRVSTAEKSLVLQLLKKTGTSFTSEQAEHVISRVISSVRRDGFSAVLRNTRERIKKFKELGKEDVLLRCLSAVAKADGTVHEAEKKVYNLFVAALKEPIA
jgi:tellurite resistance protein